MSEHIVYPRVYLTIFLALMLGTGLTVLAAFRDFPGPLNAVFALLFVGSALLFRRARHRLEVKPKA